MGYVWNTLIGLTSSASSPEPNTTGSFDGLPSLTDEPEWRDLERRRVAQEALGLCVIVRPHWTCHHNNSGIQDMPQKAPTPTQSSRASLRVFRRKAVGVHTLLPEVRGFE